MLRLTQRLGKGEAMADPVAFITGASRGIGRQLAVDFARRGYDVACIARSTAAQPGKLPGTLDETAELVRAAGRRALAASADLSSEEQCRAAVDRTLAEFGRIDVLINNAAIGPPGRAMEQPAKLWRLAVDINLNAPFYLMAAICPRMVEAGYGRVINISSRAAVSPEFGASYTTTKRALEALTESLAFDLRGTAVSVNAIRLELDVWSEGYAWNLGPDADTSDFEDPVVMSDACLWIVDQPAEYTGRIVTIGELRALGAVRPATRYSDRA